MYSKLAVSLLLVLLVLGLLIINKKQALSPEVPQAPVSMNPQQWPALPYTITPDPALEKRVADILAKMRVEEKVGQLIQPEIKYVTPEEVKTYHLGSILNGGGTAPNNDKFSPVSDWVAMADAYYEASMDISDGGVAIPVIWGSDAVHGHNNVVGATLFPHNIGLGAAHDVDLIRRIGEATAKEVAVTGVDWTFAPTVAIARDDRWGRTYESYSEHPDIVKQYAGAMIEGLQGDKNKTQWLDDQAVVATAKHFLGDGGTHRGLDRGDTRVTEEQLIRIHAPGFIAALEAGVQTVMASFNSWNGVKMHGHRYLLTDILKNRLGFDGFVVGDWSGHRFIPGCTVESCPQAINAGLDMFMVPSDWKPLYKNTLSQVRSGKISMARLDDAVTRILRVKMRAGLFDGKKVSSRALAGQAGIMGADDHRALAREAVRKSLVLLKNNRALLPLKRSQHVLVAGSGANNIMQQNGGWTLSWQGTGNKPEDFPGATSIFEGIERVVSQGGGEAVLSEQGLFDSNTFKGVKKPDVAIVVYGEQPYAEWHGDIAGIEYQSDSKEDLVLLKNLKLQGIPVVSIFISGRPLWMNKELNASDAFVAVWLPGSQGEGVADVIFANNEGLVNYDFQGKLSFSWPKFVHQTVINYRDENYDPLFAYAYGLSYRDTVFLADNLPENSATYTAGKLEDVWVMVSRPMAPWHLYLKDNHNTKVEMVSNRADIGDKKNLSVASIDKLSQEDARKISWRGFDFGEILLEAGKPQDLTPYANESSALSFDVRIDKKNTQPVIISMFCGAACSGSVAIDDALSTLTVGDWFQLSIDLQCFTGQGVDFARVKSAFSMATEGQLGLSLANVRIVAGMAKQATVQCQG